MILDRRHIVATAGRAGTDGMASVYVYHLPTGMGVVSRSARGQERNYASARSSLAALLLAGCGGRKWLRPTPTAFCPRASRILDGGQEAQ